MRNGSHNDAFIHRCHYTLSLYYPSQLPALLLLPPSRWSPSGLLSLFYYFHYLKRSSLSFMCMGVLPVYHMQEVFMKARSAHQITLGNGVTDTYLVACRVGAGN